MLIIIVLGGLGGAFFGPQEMKAAELAERDIAASTGDTVELSAEYAAVAGRIATVGAISSLLVLIALFFMVVKP
jgi:ABC-type multidrug transport system permease subunit